MESTRGSRPPATPDLLDAQLFRCVACAAEVRDEFGIGAVPRVGRPAQDGGGVERGEDGIAALRLQDAASALRDAKAGAQQGLGRRRTETDHQRRRDRRDLRGQPRCAGADFVRRRLAVDPPLAARHPLEVLHRIGDVGVRPVDAGIGEGAVEQFPGGPDERPSLDVLLVARLPAHEHQRRAAGPLAEDRLGAAFEEALPFTALLTVFFAVVAVIADQQLFAPIIEYVLSLEKQIQGPAFYVANGVLSAVSDNVFVATVYVDEVGQALLKGEIDRDTFDLLAVAINTGTNIPSVATPNGQAAFLFLLTSALAPLVRLSYGRMVVMALPYTIVMSITGLLMSMMALGPATDYLYEKGWIEHHDVSEFQVSPDKGH